MSVDRLQEKIRKCKNPSIVEFDADYSAIPGCVLEEECAKDRAYLHYCGELLEILKGLIPGVRFSFGNFALKGSEGLSLLEDLTKLAHQMGYYVLLDAPVAYSEKEAQSGALILMGEDCRWYCDGVIVNSYIGADAIKPYAQYITEEEKSLFVVLRTGNKTGPQLQDLLTGGRLVHTALADVVSRIGQTCMGRRNYSNVCCVSAANAADSLQTLRKKYPKQFLMVEGYDYSNANAKNCSYAFDAMGHGAVVCAGDSVVAAWREGGETNPDYRQAALEAAERMRKNLLRYITVL